LDETSKGDGLQGMMGLGSHLEKLKEEEEKNRPQTRWERKMNRIFGEATVIRKNFFMGFMMGGCVGALMGGLTGTYFAFQYRQFSLIPLMALTSGGSFGFFMGIGAIMRSGEGQERIKSEDGTYTIKTLDPSTGRIK
jgi:hypothetical protein